MATQQRNPKQSDEHARTAKRLRSAVQRVRSQAGTGAQRQAALVEALNDLTAHLIEGHLWGAASPPAQESLRLSSATLFADGAVSNYTDAAVASRCGVSLVQLAVVQLGLGLDDAASATLSSWQGLATQLSEYQIGYALSPTAAAWAEYGRARSALTRGDVPGANAAVDALRGLTEALNQGAPTADSPLQPELQPHNGFLPLDVARLGSDARWLAGRSQDSLALLHAAKADYDALALEPLAEPQRHAKAFVERLAEPLFGLYRDYADRLALTGDADLALVNRRAVAELLAGLTPALPEPSTSQLAATLSDLSLDLVRAHRIPEALEAAQDAVKVAANRGCSPTIRLLAHALLAQATLADGRSEAARAGIEAAIEADGAAANEPVQRLAALVLERATDPGSAAIPAQLRDRARGVLCLHVEAATGPRSPAEDDAHGLAAERQRARELEAQRHAAAQRALELRQREGVEAERAAEAATEAAEREAAERLRIAEQRRDDAAEAERQDLKRRRAERMRRHAHEAADREAGQRADRRAEIGELVEVAEREGLGETEVARLRLELADLDQDELDAAEELRTAVAAADSEVATPVPAASGPPEQPETPEPMIQPLPPPAEPAADLPTSRQSPVDRVGQPSSDPEPQEPRSEPAPPGPERSRPERSQPDPQAVELTEAESALTQLRAEGNRKATRQASERLVQLLRSGAQTDPASFGPRLRLALEELSGLRLRGGDLFGSHAATKEAKALAKELG